MSSLSVLKETPVKHTEREGMRDSEEQQASQMMNKESGDGWQPAAGKRGRASPSPDKVLKKLRGGGVTAMKNKFQRMAEDIFRGEERGLTR
jgi:hypothetical protein